jgi:serine/threonine protein kinase
VKILDFGLALLAGAIASPSPTPAGGVVGTPGYMAPEQACDPFLRALLSSSCWPTRTNSPRPVPDFRSDVPEEMLAVLDHVLEMAKQHRCPFRQR